MQNVQDTEIQKRVINLVELYRTKVGWESQIAKEAKEEWDFWNQSLDMMAIESMVGGIYGDGPHTEEWIKHLMVNEQLLGHFYAEVAGDNADKDVLAELLPDVYDRTIFTEEDESFLKKHFKEMVNYIILTPCDESLVYVHRDDHKDIMTIPDEVLEFINSRIKVPTGSQIYNPYTGYAQFTSLFKGCKFFCDDKNPWMQVAIYANEVDAEIVANDFVPSSYNAVVSYLYESSDDDNIMTTHLCEAYKNLISGGVMVLLCPPRILTDKVHSSFRKMLIEDKAIKEIIQLPQVMGNDSDSYCLLIAEKGRHDKHVTLIDARVASEELNSRHYMLSFNIAKFNAIMENDGIDPNTGLRKMVKISSEVLSPDILIPQVYVIERPSEAEHPVPLSTLCSLVTKRVRDVQFDLPEDTPLIAMSDLTPLYTGDLDMSNIRKANCPNNPSYVEGRKDYAFDKKGRFIDSVWAQMYTEKGHDALSYRKSTYIDGNNDTVLYVRSQEDTIRVSFERSINYWVKVAIVRATGNPYAVSSGILAFCPKDNYDANSLAALLRLPIVYRQLIAYQKYGIGKHLDDIIVPLDKRIIGDELYRIKKEESVTNELGDKVQAMKTKYINEVRMKKHDMGQYIFELGNIEELMRYYLDNRETEKDFCQQLEFLLENFRSSLGELSTLLDNLSKEEQFGDPETFNVTEFLSGLEKRHTKDSFLIQYTCDLPSIKKYNKKKRQTDLAAIADQMMQEDLRQQSELAAINDQMMVEDQKRQAEAEVPLTIPSVTGRSNGIMYMPPIYVAPNDFHRLVNNILNNAKRHGFTDPNNKDYVVQINTSINAESGMYQIDFRNNGNPLPEGMNKMRYGIKGEKAGKTAGTGLGGNYVKSFVEHYGGDYDIFMENGWTVVRINLPIK